MWQSMYVCTLHVVIFYVYFNAVMRRIVFYQKGFLTDTFYRITQCSILGNIKNVSVLCTVAQYSPVWFQWNSYGMLIESYSIRLEFMEGIF